MGASMAKTFSLVDTSPASTGSGPGIWLSCLLWLIANGHRHMLCCIITCEEMLPCLLLPKLLTVNF